MNEGSNVVFRFSLSMYVAVLRRFRAREERLAEYVRAGGTSQLVRVTVDLDEPDTVRRGGTDRRQRLKSQINACSAPAERPLIGL